jgi:hypothetical protein
MHPSNTPAHHRAQALIRRDASVCSPRRTDFVIAAGTQFEKWRFWCPYGIWRCADGREVLFNRNYQAIYQRYPNQPARIAQHDEWVPWVRQEWFFNDGNSPVSWWSIPAWDWQPVVTRINKLLVGWALAPLPPRPRNKRTSSLRRQRLWQQREQARHRLLQEIDRLRAIIARADAQLRRVRPPTPRQLCARHNIQGKLRNYLLHVKPPAELLDDDAVVLGDGWRRLDAVHWWMARCLLERGVPEDEAFILLRESPWNRHRGEWRGDDKVRVLIAKAWAHPCTPWSEQRRLSAHPTERGTPA